MPVHFNRLGAPFNQYKLCVNPQEMNADHKVVENPISETGIASNHTANKCDVTAVVWEAAVKGPWAFALRHVLQIS